jgi:RNA polymerase sigma-70 factor (ECF subfamily)
MGAHPYGGSLALRLEPAPVDEQAFIAAALEGDPQARAWLLQQHSTPVYRFCLRMLANQEDAQDAAQETMVKVLRNLHRYRSDWRFSTWVFGIARNTCIDEHRRRKRRRTTSEVEVVDCSASPLELTEREMKAERLRSALDDLPPLYREVLLLYHFEQLKYREIADLLELPLGTVMNRIFRARQRLRTIYDDQEAGGNA